MGGVSHELLLLFPRFADRLDRPVGEVETDGKDDDQRGESDEKQRGEQLNERTVGFRDVQKRNAVLVFRDDNRDTVFPNDLNADRGNMVSPLPALQGDRITAVLVA